MALAARVTMHSWRLNGAPRRPSVSRTAAARAGTGARSPRSAAVICSSQPAAPGAAKVATHDPSNGSLLADVIAGMSVAFVCVPQARA